MDENKPLSMQDVIDYLKKIAESDYTTLWYQLYSYINDWAFGIAPDETTPINEAGDRLTIYNTLQKVLDVMIDFEEQERKKKNAN